MDVLLMCGGKGTRLDSEVEKPLVPVGGVPMVDRVLEALGESRAGDVHAVVSPHTPETRDYLAGLGDPSPTIVDAPGEGYVADLDFALLGVEQPVLTVVADLPLLATAVVDRVLGVALERAPNSLTVCVPAAVKRALGASIDTTFDHAGRELAPTGVNVVNGSDDDLYVSHDVRVSVNVNRPTDRTLAEGLCD